MASSLMGCSESKLDRLRLPPVFSDSPKLCRGGGAEWKAIEAIEGITESVGNYTVRMFFCYVRYQQATQPSHAAHQPCSLHYYYSRDSPQLTSPAGGVELESSLQDAVQ